MLLDLLGFGGGYAVGQPQPARRLVIGKPLQAIVEQRFDRGIALRLGRRFPDLAGNFRQVCGIQDHAGQHLFLAHLVGYGHDGYLRDHGVCQ